MINGSTSIATSSAVIRSAEFFVLVLAESGIFLSRPGGFAGSFFNCLALWFDLALQLSMLFFKLLK